MNSLKMPVEKITPAVIKHFMDTGLVDEAKELQKDLDDYQEGKKPKTEKWLSQFITVDEKMLKIKDQVRKLVSVNDSVLIIGETGTGKEILANALHGDRVGKFVAINCAGLPDNLIESELFGHVKGAFTGAYQNKVGLMKAAENGTIFLDEVGELSRALQAKLLRAIQEKRIRQVGSEEDMPINCRVVSATHRDIELLKTYFREDLYWRISTFEFRTTPLHERLNDIIPILEELDVDCKIKDFEKFLCNILTKSPNLPGNVRELQQHVRRYYVLSEEVI